jgi:hypothetical protein
MGEKRQDHVGYGAAQDTSKFVQNRQARTTQPNTTLAAEEAPCLGEKKDKTARDRELSV